MPISAGIPAPDFELLDDTNVPRKLSDFRGQEVCCIFTRRMIRRVARRKPVISVMIIPPMKRQVS